MEMKTLQVAKYERGAALYFEDEVTERCALLITDKNSNYFTQKAKRMNTDIEDAKALVNKHLVTLGQALDAVQAKEQAIVEATKITSGRLRDTVHKLSDGLAKVEKTANFDKLARYADTLERIERALSSLAEMEKTGILTKISSSLK
jgi:excinuclease UvrABC helicase subunit UvrB